MSAAQKKAPISARAPRCGRNRDLAVLLLGLTCALPLTAKTLESDSPFLPPGYNSSKMEPLRAVPSNGAPLARELEFRGVIQMGGTYRFSLYNKKEQRGYWIPAGGSQEGISVSDYDPDSMSLSVLSNGRSERITLSTATETPMPVAISAPAQVNRALTPTQASQARASAVPLPEGAAEPEQITEERRRVVPRRRVILPKK